MGMGILAPRGGAQASTVAGLSSKDSLTTGDVGGDGGKQGASNIFSNLSNAFTGATSAFLMNKPAQNGQGVTPTQKYANRLQTANAGIQGVSEGLIASKNPYAMAAGAALKLGDMAYGAFKKKVKFDDNMQVRGSGSFGSSDVGALSNSYNTSGLASLFGGKSRGALQGEANKEMNFNSQAANLLSTNARKMNGLGATTNMATARKNITDQGFQNPIAVGKLGLNTAFLSEFKKFRELRPLPILKDGGPINVIVDGKLHKELHHMNDLLDVDITRKGVPVVTKEMGDGGEIEQTAELERDEIIFHYALTKKLEELSKDGSEESMIAAGKLLVKEILKNTKDSKSKLLKTVE